MNKYRNLILSIVIAALLFAAGSYTIINHLPEAPLASLNLPAGFPSLRGLWIIWAFLALLWAVGSWKVFSSSLSPRRKRNIFCNAIILALMIFVWNYLFVVSGNLTGALAVSVMNLLLALVVWLMYLVIHRYSGYLLTPLVVWTLYTVYLSLSAFLMNR